MLWHKKTYIANYNFVIICACIIYVILIFPLLINFSIYYTNDNKTFYFSLKLFFINIIVGSIRVSKKGFILTKNGKPSIVPWKSLLNINKTAKPLKDYTITNIKITTNAGSDNLLLPCVICCVIKYADYYIYNVLKTLKPYIRYSNDVNLFEGQSFIQFYARVSANTTLLTIFISAIKIFMEKIIYATKICK